jgi:hypothetical protein
LLFSFISGITAAPSIRHRPLTVGQ